jgi:hypothetical protein
MKVLFVAGFGPIVRDTAPSQKLYKDTLAIPFKQERMATSIQKLWTESKALHYGRFLKPPSPALVKIPGQKKFPPRKRGSSWMWMTLGRRQPSLNRKAIECS